MFAGDDFKISAKASSTLGKPADSVRSDTALKASSPYPSAGSSNAPSPGSAAAADWPRIGNASTARRSPSCASPPFASCSESYAIPRDVLGQTLSGFTEGMRDRLRAFGFFSEIIAWKLRFFVPVGDAGREVFARLIEG